MFTKLLLILIKYFPIIQMLVMLLNNTIYCFTDNYTVAYTLDFFTGNSILTTILLYMISIRFNYCIWHRLIITGNLINLILANVDASIGINVSDMGLLLMYYFIAFTFILLASYSHIKYIHNERKIRTSQEYTTENN